MVVEMFAVDFKCPHCGHTQEEWFIDSAHAADAKAWRCSECGADDMQKVPGAPAFRIEGYNAANGYSKK